MSKKVTKHTGMSVSALKDTLRMLLTNNIKRSVMMWGPPGVGKSAVIAQLAQENKIGFVDIRLSQLAPTDLRGLPVPKDGISSWYPPEFLPSDQKSVGILFFDEMNMAAPTVQGIAQQLVLDRRVGSYVVPPGWFIWAAGNRREDKAAVYEMPAPLKNRFLHLFTGPDHTAFHKYAVNKGFHEHTIAFLNFRPELLHKQSDDHPNWPSPRTWEMASELHSIQASIEPAVGPGTCAEFNAFLKVYKQIGYVDDIMAGKGSGKKFPTDEASAAYAIVTALGLRAKSLPQAQNSFEWINGQAKAEWIQIFVSNLAGRWQGENRISDLGKLIQRSPEFKSYLKDYAELMKF